MIFLSEERIKGSLLGVVVGDALGCPYEFQSKEQFTKRITDFEYVNNIFTEDTSLTLCTVEALVEKGYNLSEIAKLFLKWFNEGYWSSDGKNTIGVGLGIAEALTRMKKMNLVEQPELAGNIYEMSNCNGSLMRILPIVLFSLNQTLENLLESVHKGSMITHAHPRSQMACGIYALFLREIFDNNNAIVAYSHSIELAKNYYQKVFPQEINSFKRIFSGELLSLSIDKIKTSGYVVDTLEASLWCVLHYSNFQDTVLGAVNMGGDTDTIGAITGSIAGCIYGVDTIPQEWLSKITRIDDATKLINKYAQLLVSPVY